MMTTRNPRPRRLALIGMMALAGLPLAAGLGRSAAATGPDAYDKATNYKAGQVVLGSDGNSYRAASAVTGSDPVTAAAAWQLAHVAKNVTLDVPGRFKTIAEALQYLAGCRIAENAKVTILVAPGAHEHAAAVLLGHADGARIVLRGAGEKPENCRIVFIERDADLWDGFILTNGHAITIENLTIESGTKSGKGIGVAVAQGSVVTLKNVRVVDFNCNVDGNSQLTAFDCTWTLEGAGDAVHVRNGSQAFLSGCTATAKRRVPNAIGFHAYNNATLYCVDCRAVGWGFGFKAYANSSMHLERCTARDSLIGAKAAFGSSMNAMGCTFADNAECGIGALASTAAIIDCTLTGNELGVLVIGNAFVKFLDKPSTISGGKFGIRPRSGGRVDLEVAPRFVNVPEKYSVLKRPGDLTVEEAIEGDR